MQNNNLRINKERSSLRKINMEICNNDSDEEEEFVLVKKKNIPTVGEFQTPKKLVASNSRSGIAQNAEVISTARNTSSKNIPEKGRIPGFVDDVDAVDDTDDGKLSYTDELLQLKSLKSQDSSQNTKGGQTDIILNLEDISETESATTEEERTDNASSDDGIKILGQEHIERLKSQRKANLHNQINNSKAKVRIRNHLEKEHVKLLTDSDKLELSTIMNRNGDNRKLHDASFGEEIQFDTLEEQEFEDNRLALTSIEIARNKRIRIQQIKDAISNFTENDNGSLLRERSVSESDSFWEQQKLKQLGLNSREKIQSRTALDMPQVDIDALIVIKNNQHKMILLRSNAIHKEFDEMTAEKIKLMKSINTIIL